MSTLPTTVKIIDDPTGAQARSEHANLIEHAGATVKLDGGKAPDKPGDEHVKASPTVLAPKLETVASYHSVESVQTPAGGASKVVLHGVIQKGMTANNSGFQVDSGHHGTTVTIHRPLVTQEVAPGVHINQGYLPAPGEIGEPSDPDVEALPLGVTLHDAPVATKKPPRLSSSHRPAPRPPKKARAKKAKKVPKTH